MGFYDNNPGAKNAFATAGAIHDGTSTDTGTATSAPDAASPNGTAAMSKEEARSGMQGNTDPGTGQFYEGNTNPFTDPDFAGGGDPKSNAMRASGLAFDAGGAMPDDDTQTDQSQGDDPQTDQSNPIDALFTHGRQKMGLMQMAGAIPNAPGTQSPGQPQPMPGPLPPTANPFGKRPTPPTPGRLSEVVPMNNGLKGAAGQYKNWGRDKTKPDDNSNVIPLQPVKTSDVGAIPEGDEEEAA